MVIPKRSSRISDTPLIFAEKSSKALPEISCVPKAEISRCNAVVTISTESLRVSGAVVGGAAANSCLPLAHHSAAGSIF
jgi:hypothetical protein